MSSSDTSSPEGASRVIDSVRDAEQAALESVRTFVETVNGVFPDLSEDGPRRKIIDAAFRMTERLVGASAELARKIVTEANDARAGARPTAGPSR